LPSPVTFLSPQLTLTLGIELLFKIELNNAIKNGIRIIWLSIERHDLLGDINYRIRMLDLKGKDMLIQRNETLDQLERRYKDELFVLIDQLQDDSFEIIRLQLSMEELGA
jgi:hypothetical protein